MTGTPHDPTRGAKGPGAQPDDSTPLGEYAGLAFQFAISVIVFVYAGQWLDRKLGWAPWGLMVSVFLGAGLSFYSMYRKLMAVQARDEAARAARRASGQ